MKRREFIYTTAWGGAIGLAMPDVFAATSSSIDPILVVIHLAGGNDGLNTVIPIDNDYYHNARPKLGIRAADALKINDTTGLHSNLTGLMKVYDQGQLAIVEGVGYPNPNRSHFRSTEIWHTGSDSDRVERYGWLGRYFDTYCGDKPASIGLTIGKQSPQAFDAARPTGVTFFDEKQLKTRGGGDNDPMMQDAGPVENEDNDSGGSIGSISGGGGTSTMDPLAFLENTQVDAQISSRQIESILKTVKPEQEYPNARFAQELKMVSQLIRGDMPSKVYYLSRGGFDTHKNQAGAHNQLMREVGDALQAFNTEMQRTGQAQRVTVMVYSEFGRRVKENGSSGTDHGVAGPVFVMGGSVKGGMYGKAPDLAPDKLLKGDLVHTTDYRSVYATLLEKHLQVDAKPVLLKPFQTLDFI